MKPDYEQDNLKLFRADCMEVMKQYPDNYFDASADRIYKETRQMELF